MPPTRSSPYRATRQNDYSSMKEKLSEIEKELRLRRGEDRERKENEEIMVMKIKELIQESKKKDEKIKELEDRIERKETAHTDTNRETDNMATSEITLLELPAIQTLLKSNEQLQEEIKATNTTLASMAEESKQIKDEVAATQATIVGELGNTIRKNEFANQLAKNARNVGEYANIDREIMAFGVQEDNEDNYTARMKKEREVVTTILKAIDETWDGQGLIEHRRCGRYTPDGKARPLKITLGSSQMATNFVQQAKILKDNTQLKEVGIRKCLCKPDRDTLRESVQEMKKLNNERSEEERENFFWSIRNLKPTKMWIRQTQNRPEEGNQGTGLYQ